MRKIKNNLINEMKQMLDNKKSLTVESLIFNEAEDEYGMENEYDEIPMDDYNSKKPKSSMSCSVESEVKPMVDQIRKMTLQGIAKLAEHPECETYSTLKKIWQLVDKATEMSNKNSIKESKRYSLNEGGHYSGEYDRTGLPINDEEYIKSNEYIIDSIINGNISQARDLIRKLTYSEFFDLVELARENGCEDDLKRIMNKK